MWKKSFFGILTISFFLVFLASCARLSRSVATPTDTDGGGNVTAPVTPSDDDNKNSSIELFGSPVLTEDGVSFSSAERDPFIRISECLDTDLSQLPSFIQFTKTGSVLSEGMMIFERNRSDELLDAPCFAQIIFNNDAGSLIVVGLDDIGTLGYIETEDSFILVAGGGGDDPVVTFCNGTGDEHDPYMICTAEELNLIGDHADYMASYFKLSNGIDLDDLVDVTFNTIGSSDHPFTGNFDGNGFIISNLSVTATGWNHTGFIARLGTHGVVNDVKLEDVDVVGGDYTGGLVGVSDTGSCIEDSYVTGQITAATTGTAGGLVGLNTGTIIGSHFTGEVIGSGSYLGGLAGNNGTHDTQIGLIANSYATGTVTDAGNVGYAGGLVCINWVTDHDARTRGIYESFATNAVSGCYAGGLVESNYGTIADSYATGAVTGIHSTMCPGYAGGLVHSNLNGVIKNSYAAGLVVARGATGGLADYDFGLGTYINSYWDKTTTDQETSVSDGGTGKTHDLMILKTTFQPGPEDKDNWDFTDVTGVWTINDGVGYPTLQHTGSR